MLKAMVISNPSSGNNQADQAVALLNQRLTEHYQQIDHVETQQAGDGKLAAESACQNGYDAVFAIGGDGTISEIINGIAGQSNRPTLGLIPAGTNNTYVQLLGYAGDYPTAIQQINFSQRRSVDIGLCNDTYFDYYISFGHLIDATTSTTEEEKSKFGSFAYLKNMIQALPNERKIQIELHSNTQSYVGEAAYVFVLLSNLINGEAVAKNKVTLEDGQFYVVIVEDERLLTKLDALVNILAQRLEETDGVTTFTCSSLTIDSNRPEEVNLDLDGDIAGHLPAAIQLLPHHIDIFMPSKTK